MLQTLSIYMSMFCLDNLIFFTYTMQNYGTQVGAADKRCEPKVLNV